jgi:hypothetical protein
LFASRWLPAAGSRRTWRLSLALARKIRTSRRGIRLCNRTLPARGSRHGLQFDGGTRVEYP